MLRAVYVLRLSMKRLGLVSRSQHSANETAENRRCRHTGLEVSERALESPSRCDGATIDIGVSHATCSLRSWVQSMTYEVELGQVTSLTVLGSLWNLDGALRGANQS